MTTNLTLSAETRQNIGKGASRRLRREANKIPGIIYGADKEATPITLAHNEVLKLLAHEAAYSQIITLSVDGKSQKVVLRDVQRHVYKPKVNHMDFLRVSAKQKLTMQIPLHFVGEEKCPGIAAGGVISHSMNEVEITCLPQDLPEFFEVDVSTLELDHAIHLSALKLPSNVELTTKVGEDHDPALVSVHIPKEEPVEKPEVEAAEGEEGEEGETSEGSEDKPAEGKTDDKAKPAESDNKSGKSDKSE